MRFIRGVAGLALLIHLLVFVAPLAVYCMVLAMVNRRLRPVAVRGTWDLAGIIFAMSGLLFYVAPSVLALLYEKTLRAVPLDMDRSKIKAGFAGALDMWLGLTIVYFAVLAGVGGVLFWMRRRQFVIYNLDAASFDAALTRAVAALGLTARRYGNHVVLGAARDPADEPTAVMSDNPVTPDNPVTADNPARTAPARPGVVNLAQPLATLEIDAFPALCNVSLTWREHVDSVRLDVERELTKALAEVRTFDNPAGGWFLGVAAALFSVLFLVTVFLVLVVVFRVRL